MIRYLHLPSPIGRLTVAESEAGLVAILFEEEVPPDDWRPVEALESDAAEQLTAYFAAGLQEFDLPLAPEGTDFQLRVWQRVGEIPYGETRSYRQIADTLGDSQAVRAVGAANGLNPLPVVVPCHRVLGSDGSLTGYAGGVIRKRRLLELEQPLVYGPGPLFVDPGRPV